MSLTPRLALVALALAGTTLARPFPDADRLTPRKPLTKQEQDRREAQKLFGTAALHERGNRLIEAVRAYEQAERLDPDSAAIPRALFGLYVALDRTDDALAACKKVLRLDPDDAATAFLYARQLRGLDRKKEAIAALDQGAKSPRLKGQPDLAAQLWFDLGVLHEQQGNWAKAEKALRQVVAILESPTGLIDSGKHSREEINSQAAETLERIGKVCLKAKRIDDAVTAFEQAKKKDALRAPRLAYHLAQVYRDAGKPREALDQLNAYLRGQPQGVEGYEMRIELQRKLGRDADIVPDLEAASGRDPHNVALKLLLARELRKVRRSDEALAIYNKLLEIHVTADVYRGLFELQRDRGVAGVGQVLDLLDATMDRAAGDEAKKRAASEADARRARAMLQVLRDDAGLVRTLLPLAVNRPRLKYPTRVVLGTLAARTKQMALSEQLYRACLDRPGGLGAMEAEVYAGLLTALRHQRKHAEIVKVCQAGLRTAQQTNRVMFHTELVFAHQHLGDHKAALAAADAAVTDAGKTQLLRCKRIRVDAHVQAGQADKALAECQEMLKEYNAGGDLRDVRYAMSSVYQAMGKHDEAEEQLRLILRSDPNDATANNDLGYVWADRNKNLDEAERMIRKAIELDKQQRSGGTSLDPDADRDNAAYVDSLGWVLFRKGKVNDARRELEKAAALPTGDEDPVVWDHLGDVYYRLKQTAKATEMWKKALQRYDEGARRKSDGRYREIQEKLRRLTTP
jgi:tetratricopeptide (TPR) repeat protein